MRAFAIGVVLVLVPLAGWAQTSEEQLIAVLQSNAAVSEKETACRRLKGIGTAKAVPALAALLTDESLSQWARDALETMPVPEAGEALRAALGKTAGSLKAGIIDTLAVRRERAAVPDLVRALGDKDAVVASAAGAALGKIGGSDAVSGLRVALARAGLTNAPASQRSVLLDSLLRCADGMLAAGDTKGAAAVYERVLGEKAEDHFRTAAFRGMLLAAGKGSAGLAAAALKGDDVAQWIAALDFVRAGGARGATAEFAGLVASAAPNVRVPLIDALAQRGDVAALPAIVSAARSKEPEVQAAALSALGELGDAAQVGLLADAAAGPASPARDAARRALVRLWRGDVHRGLVGILGKARPAAQIEVARALAARGDRAAVPALLKLAGGPDEKAAVAALQAAAQLAGEAELPGLVKLVVAAKSDGVRDAAEAALVAAGGRCKSPDAAAGVILPELPKVPVPARCALLRAAGAIGGAGVLEALRAATHDADAQVCEAGARTMAAYAGVDALPDLAALAKGGDALGIEALRGYWRVVGLATDKPAPERLRLCADGMALARRPEEKRLGLAEIARIPDLGALKMAQDACKDEAIRGEAELASVQVAAKLLATNRTEAEAALRKLAADAGNEQARTDAKAALDTLTKYQQYVMPWLAAGPYRQQGKECQALFDIPFDPEQPDKAAGVTWQPAPLPADPALAWQVDLGPVVKGDHAVAYIKTRVYSPKEQPVALAAGADDGIKLWVNGEVVISNNAVRALTPDQDKGEATLKQGWNDFLAKISQHTLGCGACLRITTPEGATVEGLRVDPKGM